MRAIIVEDEKPAADRLKSLIAKTGFKIDVVAVLDSITSSVEWLRQNQPPNLIFLDIHLADGQSFEIFRSTTVDVPVIFTTAYDEYALQAFDHNCIDYLLKPIDQEKLHKSLQKMNQWMTLGNQKLMELLEKNLKGELANSIYKDRFLVKGKDKLISIDTDQIAYFQSMNKVVVLVTHENRSFPVDHTMEDLENMLNPVKFFRINRSFIANVLAIVNMEPYFNGKIMVTLKPSVKAPVFVSREKSKTFKKWLGE